MEVKPAFVIFAGDLANHGEDDAYRHLLPICSNRLHCRRALPWATSEFGGGPAFRSLMLDGAGEPERPLSA